MAKNKKLWTDKCGKLLNSFSKDLNIEKKNGSIKNSDELELFFNEKFELYDEQISENKCKMSMWDKW